MKCSRCGSETIIESSEEGCLNCAVPQANAHPQLCDGWLDARRETPTDGESYLIWIYGGSEERNEGYIIDGCFINGMYFSADGISINAVAWMKRPAPPAFA